MNAILKR